MSYEHDNPGASSPSDAPAAEKPYAPFTHVFSDPWADGEEISITHRFARPSKPQIARFSKEVQARNTAFASNNLLLSIIHPDEKARLQANMEAHPGLTTTFGGAIAKACGFADLGN